MKCTLINEPGDTPDWHDNYLCVPKDSPFDFKWSFAGCFGDLDCISLNEPADPNYWFDNYLCHKRTGGFNEILKTYCHYFNSNAIQFKLTTLVIILSIIFVVLSGRVI